MEHSSALSCAPAIIANTNNVTPLPEPRRARTLFDLVERFEGQESLQNPDAVLPLNRLRMTPDETIEVPGLGQHVMNDWSRRQMSSLLGLRWDRWFQNAGGHERAEEINRRLARATDEVKVRTTRAIDGGQEADGTLRAFVSPGFSPIEDSQVSKLVIAAMRTVDGEMKIIRADVTDRTTSFVVGIGRPYRVGGEGEVGDVWGGIMIRNSGVGFASLLIVAHLVRLACRNGMTLPLPDSELLRRRHRGIDEDKLRWMLSDRLQQLPGKLRVAVEVLRDSASRRVDAIEDEVRRILDHAGLPLRFLTPILEAHRAETLPGAFGVSQAITRAAQQFSPEERLELEQAAGQYLRSLS
ncbi:MAG TPA: hypothetical protein PLI95_26370 [Polyangiaceae bacterium]|nr:hypothetical protein [Polyangiaceae bacterium]